MSEFGVIHDCLKLFNDLRYVEGDFTLFKVISLFINSDERVNTFV